MNDTSRPCAVRRMAATVCWPRGATRRRPLLRPPYVRVVVAAGLALGLGMGLSACVPWPHVVQLRPDILGELSAPPELLASSRLYLSARASDADPCATPGEAVLWSAPGRFRLPAKDSTQLVMAPLVPPALRISASALCLEHPELGRRLLATLFAGAAQRQQVQLICHLGTQLQLPPQPSVTRGALRSPESPQACAQRWGERASST